MLCPHPTPPKPPHAPPPPPSPQCTHPPHCFPTSPVFSCRRWVTNATLAYTQPRAQTGERGRGGTLWGQRGGEGAQVGRGGGGHARVLVKLQSQGESRQAKTEGGWGAGGGGPGGGGLEAGLTAPVLPPSPEGASRAAAGRVRGQQQGAQGQTDARTPPTTAPPRAGGARGRDGRGARAWRLRRRVCVQGSGRVGALTGLGGGGHALGQPFKRRSYKPSTPSTPPHPGPALPACTHP